MPKLTKSKNARRLLRRGPILASLATLSLSFAGCAGGPTVIGCAIDESLVVALEIPPVPDNATNEDVGLKNWVAMAGALDLDNARKRELLKQAGACR